MSPHGTLYTPFLSFSDLVCSGLTQHRLPVSNSPLGASLVIPMASSFNMIAASSDDKFSVSTTNIKVHICTTGSALVTAEASKHGSSDKQTLGLLPPFSSMLFSLVMMSSASSASALANIRAASKSSSLVGTPVK